MVKAIFFDLGSTLWDDYPAELQLWRRLTETLPAHGVRVSMDDLIAESREVIATYSPALTRSIVFRLLKGDLDRCKTVIDDLIAWIQASYKDAEQFRKHNPLFPGVLEMLGQLAQQYPLAIVSQNFSEVEKWMGYHGLNNYFQHIAVSNTERIYKPDTRLFLLPCEVLGVNPEDVMMVGDRLDNDIWPANKLGMTTVRVLADPYRIQRPRYHRDVPDFTVEKVTDLLNLL